ncbi:TetR/AcrR family transcriptional regulator [Roseibium aestuarii]|uniref:TetR/AcrR family transcriptional regulator n=1 Tax=Roseibium aestuarii TaxID=2600299 RepID=A0ABW4JQT1_9HYPH|nr:TetR/AcrR family transcriptional regulator [Roseibium aestuarii]
MTDLSTRDLLLKTASDLFRRKGYDGVGLSEILKASGVPKGSLYHHFPGGKAELGAAATRWIGGVLQRRLDRAFESSASFTDGMVALCALLGDWVALGACPVMSVVQAGDQDPQLREAARAVLDDWRGCLRAHAERLGEPDPEDLAEQLLMQLEGAWVIASAEGEPRAFRKLSDFLQKAQKLAI